ncbi:RNA ligase/cyclic nucleotide phosphodiesterase [Legionella steigerwaltii]|uniref:RNA 2',3'-cyclic phosphodiesterase n=1 Tax=Legionella steigerwaltii TaxID=460 RepID=A0A378L4P0_9GAMM|nr:RNA 2',3'-cyclic phosphodiesterase [Legionella steigerwaltii]KTD69914.1 RNA ligase/cyclic nucleotide phosphodiesterase [Legionella steigerwaltii]STY21773.1 RNA ligase/cyclic nucleotide phosphodiesterase [Legionella steigerwaltii]
MHPLRVFFAINFPNKTQGKLSSCLHSLQETISSDYIRWVQVEKMHITLQFLGNLPPEQLISVIEQVHTTIKNLPTFQLELGHWEWFPTSRHPKVLALSVQPQATLAALSDAIGSALIALNIPVETRPFRGHLTLGRVIRHKVPHELLETIKMPIIPPIAVGKIYLIESRPEKGKQNYYPLAEFKLA